MAKRTKRLKSTARYGTRYGIKAKDRVRKVEEKQRKRQTCPLCNKTGVKRLSAGIWKCNKCKKKFASNTYSLN